MQLQAGYLHMQYMKFVITEGTHLMVTHAHMLIIVYSLVTAITYYGVKQECSLIVSDQRIHHPAIVIVP